MKIAAVFFHYYPPIGGCEISIQTQLESMAKEGHECSALCFLDIDGKSFTTTKQTNLNGVSIISVPQKIAAIEINKIIKRNDVIITGLQIAPLIIGICKKYNKKTINIVCDDICFKNKEILKSIRNSDIVIANSDYTHEKLETKKIKNYLLHPSFNTEDSNETFQNKEHILFVNPKKHKGYEIIKHLIKKFHNKYKFVIVGETTDKIEAKNVEYVGTVYDKKIMDNLYKKSFVVLVPSQVSETFSMVAAEAIWRYIPVIASNYGALSETVGDCGLLVDKWDDPIVWQESLESFLCSESKIKKSDIELKKQYFNSNSLLSIILDNQSK
jgi:glycosyltransferase involved in cell wall biosynthesis